MRLISVLLVATAASASLPSCGPLCRSRGGRYISVHRGTKRICDLPAKDTGKVCRSNSDCEAGYCRCPSDVEERLRKVFQIRRLLTSKLRPIFATGRCQRFSFRGGFRCVVQRGRAESDFILID